MNKTSIPILCKNEFGKHPLEIIHKTIGICNEVYELKFESSSFILRMNKEKERIYGNYKFLPFFQKLKINVPTIISEDYSETKYPFCYKIHSCKEGQDLQLLTAVHRET